MHAHCTAGSSNGSVTIAFSNMDESVTYSLALPTSSATVTGTAPPLGSQQRVEYHLTAANATEGIDTRRLLLNNATPLAVGNSTELPPLAGDVVAAGSSGTITVEPVSMGWVVFPDAGAPACM